MKQQWKGFWAGVIATTLLLGFAIPALAAYQKTATLDYTGVKIVLAGKEITPKDAQGNPVEPFLLDGAVYLPVRGVAAALGLEVTRDQTAQKATLRSAGASNSTHTQCPAILPAGVYAVGTDVAAGVYQLTAKSGGGRFYVIHAARDRLLADAYFQANARLGRLTLSKGDEIHITDDLVVTLAPVS